LRRIQDGALDGHVGKAAAAFLVGVAQSTPLP